MSKKITKEIAKLNGFNTVDEFYKAVEDLKNATIPTRQDFSVTRVVTKLTSEGQRHTKTQKMRISGTPFWDEKPDQHVIDSSWVRRPLDDDETGGVSLVEYMKAGGPQNHRFYPNPMVATGKSKKR